MTSIGRAMPKRGAADLPDAGAGSRAGPAGSSVSTMHPRMPNGAVRKFMAEEVGAFSR